MKIYIEWTGLLYIQEIKNKSFIELEDNTAISALYDKLNLKKDHQKYITCFVNGSEKKKSNMLKDGDKVKLFLPTGGG
jgi:molybdopterin converting factor small subunit